LRKPAVRGMFAIGSAIGLIPLPVLAFWLPTTHDDIGSVAADVCETLKVEATHAATVRANRLQVIRAEVVEGDLDEAEVTWRTLFGLEFGTTTVTGDSARTEIDYVTFGLVWASFLVTEIGLAVCLLYVRTN
jgi:hypothetical protein